MTSAPTPLVARSLAYGISSLFASVGLFVGACMIGGAGRGEAVFFVVGAAAFAAAEYADTLRKERGRLPSSPTPLALIFVPATRASRLLRKAASTFAFSLVVLALIGALVAFLMRVLADGSALDGFVLITAAGAGLGLGQVAYAIWLRKWEMHHELELYWQKGDPSGRLSAVRAKMAETSLKGNI